MKGLGLQGRQDGGPYRNKYFFVEERNRGLVKRG